MKNKTQLSTKEIKEILKKIIDNVTDDDYIEFNIGFHNAERKGKHEKHIDIKVIKNIVGEDE